jgi:hypothetical protein
VEGKLSNEFWLGIGLSIPIGIGTGLAVAPIQKWIDNRSEASRQTKRERQKQEYMEVLFFLRRPELLASQLILRVLSLLGLLTIITFASLGEAVLPKELTGQVAFRIQSEFWKGFYLVVTLGGLVAGISIITRVIDNSITLYHRVVRFEKYAESISSDIRDLEIEALIKQKAEL